jgi:phosphoenolpyruvate synthase/pyruvate phosphate dikinase
LSKEFNVKNFGGKAANLMELREAGFPVPDFFPLSACFTGSHNHPKPDGRSLLDMAVSACGGFPVAVRSSATAEDGDADSFAGQYETVLNVQDMDGLEAAIAVVRGSADSDRVREYQQAKGLAADSGVAVLIQKMVPAAVAGVMFTAEPVESDDTLIAIEAVSGLGDKLVGGEVNPDLYIVRKEDFKVVEQEIVDNRILPDQSIQLLAETGLAIEAHFGCPQDIEWAMADGSLFILQSRPITTL